MKKALFIITCLSLSLFACKKKQSTVSQVENTSYPVIVFSTPAVISIHTGGALPEITATAHDTVTNETGLPVTIIGQNAIDNTTPGLYIIQAEARNKYGFITRDNVFVAVTDISDDWDLSGEYVRMGNGVIVNITKEARGLYRTSDLGGINDDMPGYFVQLDDSTLVIPPQPSSFGEIYGQDVTLETTPPDTIISYRLINPSFGAGVRTFVKQH